MVLKRSNVEFSKRVFLDRLTTDAQPLFDPTNIDAGPGELYDYGGVYSPFNFGVGADCSGAAGIVIGAAVLGSAGMAWTRLFSTETFPGPFTGFRQVGKDDLVNGNYPIKVCIMHGGGGPNSHMNVTIDGWLMESNGDYGTCTLNYGAIPQDSPFWNDFWILDGPIDEDTDWRQPRSYPLGLDYATGPIAGASLKQAGVVFVGRYVTDGGSQLPKKLLTRTEVDDLRANGIEIVSNWASYADRMREGYAAGQADAQAANATHLAVGGPPNAPIYFSCGYDEPESDQAAINEYLRACGDVLGGPQRVGIYGGYWPLSRALNAGVCRYGWQTGAWSGGNIDSRVNIVQRNGLSYRYIDGVECDIDEAHAADFGQWSMADAVPTAPEVQPVAIKRSADDLMRLVYEQLCGRIDPSTGHGVGLPELGQDEKGHSLSLVDAVARLQKTVDGLTKADSGPQKAADGGKKPSASKRKSTPTARARPTNTK